MEIRPALPEGLRTWEKRLVWRVSGSLLPGSVHQIAGNGSLALTGVALGPWGDWLHCKPWFPDGSGGLAESGFADLGWTSGRLAPPPEGSAAAGDGFWGNSVVLDWAGGCAAGLLERIEAAGDSWRGLNLVRLESELRLRGLDSRKMDGWRLFDAVTARNVALWDLSELPRHEVPVPLPPGDWLDYRGQPCGEPSGDGFRKMELPEGTSTLYRQDAGAYLRVTVRMGGDGGWQASVAEHRYRE